MLCRIPSVPRGHYTMSYGLHGLPFGTISWSDGVDTLTQRYLLADGTAPLILPLMPVFFTKLISLVLVLSQQRCKHVLPFKSLFTNQTRVLRISHIDVYLGYKSLVNK